MINWKITSVKAYDMNYDNKKEEPRIVDIKVTSDKHLKLIKSYENAGVLSILDETEDYVDVCPVCGTYMIHDDEESLLQHSECPKCGYFDNIYINAIEAYGKEYFEEKKKEIGLLNE